jgi:hypothetical protein
MMLHSEAEVVDRRESMMNCSSPIYRGRIKDRFLFVVVYTLVVFGFLKNAHILQQYNKNGAASLLFDNHNLPAKKPPVVKNGLLAPSVCEAFTTSVPIFWKQFESEIKEAAVTPLATSDYPEDQNNNTRFHDWIAQLFQDHYQSYQVRRSAIHPPGLEDTVKVLEIISKRVDYLRLDEDTPANAADAAPPLHILVTGGSLTAGMACGENPIGLTSRDWRVEYRKCAWSTRLEHLFNHVLFQGKEVVKVSNLATGGANSEIGKTLLEYHLFPDAFELPHIVIWSHAANDAQEKDKERAYFESIPGYVNAAHNLRMCDSNLPLVVMNEEFFSQNNDISGMIYKASNWFGLMGISHRNVISHKTFANFHNDEYIKSIIGSKGVHPGMAAHIGVAWTVFYNFISAFTDACDYKRVGGGGGRLISNDVTAKSIGSYRENGYGDISSEWEKHQKTRLAKCSGAGDDGGASSNNATATASSSNQQPCTYAFMVNRMTSVGTSADVNKKMSEVLVSNTGWKAEGFPIKQPRAGFYAKEANAHFSLKIDVVSTETKYVTIMSMKSYGDNFKDTKLQVDVRIERKEEAPGTASAAEEDVAKYEVSGYHETTTSIHVPHKFELPNGGAKKGDSIIVDFRLVSGSYFKIAGLAFCRY